MVPDEVPLPALTHGCPIGLSRDDGSGSVGRMPISWPPLPGLSTPSAPSAAIFPPTPSN
jgi:hypothetical protein